MEHAISRLLKFVVIVHGLFSFQFGFILYVCCLSLRRLHGNSRKYIVNLSSNSGI